MKVNWKYVTLTLLIFGMTNCSDNSLQSSDDELSKKGYNPAVRGEIGKRKVQNEKMETFDVDYFSGQAEIATYTLKKARYEDYHSGEAVLVFVTEPFLIEEQVKADQPTSENSVKVLKLNRLDRFTTGIYDYSQFTSVFTPIEQFDAYYPLKITMGSQDWCGQSFTQINNNKGFEYEHRSYFETEGDTTFHLDYVLTEDNLMNLLRLDKDRLPTGEFLLLPNVHYLRTSHDTIKHYESKASIEKTEIGFNYTYRIPALNRTVTFYADTSKHNRITKWEETYPTVFDDSLRTSIYELKGVEVLPYWELNKKENKKIREDLKLMY